MWHSLTEDGKVEVVDIKFGNKKYENVSVKHLTPTDESSHSHKRTGKELDDKKKKKVKESIMNESIDDLVKIVEELRKASKMHASQADRIQNHIDSMNENNKTNVVEKFNFLKMLTMRLTLTGSTLRPRTVEQKGKIAKELKELVWPLYDNGSIKPVLFKTFALSEAGQAHALMESSTHIGKIMLKCE